MNLKKLRNKFKVKIFKLNYTLLLVFITLFFIVFGGCRKITQMRLKGKWEAVDLTGLNGSKVKEEWTFYDGGVLTISSTFLDSDNLPYNVTNNGKYRMKAAKKMLLSGYVHESMKFYNTHWEIVDISKTRLLLVNDQDKTSGLYFIEFLRKKD